MKTYSIIWVLLLAFSACNSGDETNTSSLPPMAFDKALWSVKDKEGKQYVHRSRMINDLLTNYKWAGVTKDSVIMMLGQPSDIAENSLFYTYESRPMLLGTAIESVVFPLSADGNTVTTARLSGGGFD